MRRGLLICALLLSACTGYTALDHQRPMPEDAVIPAGVIELRRGRNVTLYSVRVTADSVVGYADRQRTTRTGFATTEIIGLYEAHFSEAMTLMLGAAFFLAAWFGMGLLYPST